jgi:hypothetical protein
MGANSLAVSADTSFVRWQKPAVSLWEFCLGVAAFTVLLFIMQWAGSNNGPIPMFWGDPISFGEAIGKLPRTFGIVLVGGIVLFLIHGVRSGGDSSSDTDR